MQGLKLIPQITVTALLLSIVQTLLNPFLLNIIFLTSIHILLTNYTLVSQSHLAFIHSYFNKEVVVERMSGPFSCEEVEAILGPF